MPAVKVRYFNTRAEACAFAAGMSHVNDGAISDINVTEHSVSGSTVGAVNYEDDEDYFDAEDYADAVVIEASELLGVYDAQ